MSLAAQMRNVSDCTVNTGRGGSPRQQHVKSLISTLRAKGPTRKDALDLQNDACVRLIAYARTHRVKRPKGLLRRIILNLRITSITRDKRASSRGYQSPRVLANHPRWPRRSRAAEQEVARVTDVLCAASRRTCQISIAHRGGCSYQEIAAAFAIKPARLRST